MLMWMWSRKEEWASERCGADQGVRGHNREGALFAAHKQRMRGLEGFAGRDGDSSSSSSSNRSTLASLKKGGGGRGATAGGRRKAVRVVSLSRGAKRRRWGRIRALDAVRGLAAGRNKRAAPVDKGRPG